MQRPSSQNNNIIKATEVINKWEIPEQKTIPELPKAAAISQITEKARKYDKLMILLEANEKHYEHMVSLTKSYINKEMVSPIDFYQKGTLLGYEDILGDIRILLDR